MSTPKQPKGPWINRFAIRAFTLLLGVLFFWLLGFFVDDIGSLEGPKYEEIEARHLDQSLVTKKAAQDTQLADLTHQVENQQANQHLLETSSQNLQQTVNQLLELQKQGLEKNLSLSDEQKASQANAMSVFLANQQKYQELSQNLARLLQQKQSLEDSQQKLEAQLEDQRRPARAEFETLSARHRWTVAFWQLAVLLPLLGIGVFLAVKKRGSLYFPLYLAFGGATLVKVGLVVHEYFPSRYFHYILIGALIVVVARVLIHFLRATAAPKLATLLKQYREAYECFLCAVCEYPIRTGPRRFLFWTRRTVNKLVVPNPEQSKQEAYVCPACGTSLFEACPACGQVRHSLLPHCQHCGVEKGVATAPAA